MAILYASMYGNTASAADALAGALAERGVRNIAVYDVSNMHVSELISEIFRVSHLVFATPTYNGGILSGDGESVCGYEGAECAEKDGCADGERHMGGGNGEADARELAEMKDMTVLDAQVTVKSAMLSDQDAELLALADAVAESLK